MNKTTLTLIIFATLFILTACGATATPQTPLEPVSPTETLAQPTALPATEAVTEAPTVETVPTEAPVTEAPTASGVSFANDVQPILNQKCINCHGVDRIREGLDLRTYDTLFAGSQNGSVITPGDANNSLFVQLIVEGEMPNRGTPVTPEELQIIIDWVNQGALNN